MSLRPLYLTIFFLTICSSVQAEEVKTLDSSTLVENDKIEEEENSNSKSSEDKERLTKSRKALWVAHVLRQKTEGKSLKNLELVSDRLPVYLVPQGESFRPLVKLRLNYNRPGWQLYLSDKDPVRKSNNNNEYTVYAYLRSRISTITMTTVGPSNEIESETFYMFAPEAREYKMVSIFDSVLFTVGHTYLVYRQTTFGTFVSQSLLVGAKFISPEKGYDWGYFADASMSVFTYTSSPSKESPQFFDARAGASYLVKVFDDPKYRSRFTLGASTINLFSFGSPFGFSGLYGPNMGFRTEFYMNANHSYAAELQLAPYEFADFLTERTIKISFDFNKNLNNLRRGQIGLSYANHYFSSGSERIRSDQLNIYGSLSF